MARLKDVVVLLPGIMGSVLERNGKDVWAASAGGILNAVSSRLNDIQSLRLDKDPADQQDLGDGVKATRVMPFAQIIPGLWKVDGYSLTSEAIEGFFENVQPGRNYFEFPYDWRRDNRVAAKRLQAESEKWLKNWRSASDGDPTAKLILVAHSMGGLVSRYFLEVLGGWRSTRALITFGTPYSGSLNALNFLANGYKKAFNLIDLSEMLRSFTSIYQLLPTYKCCDYGDGQLLRVDNPRGIPNVDPTRVAAAFAFHQEIADSQAANSLLPEYARDGYRIYPVVGTHQPTLQSARIVQAGSGEVRLISDYLGQDYSGDGTVPRVSATPLEWKDFSLGMFVADRHASLQYSNPVLEYLDGVLTGLYMQSAIQREVNEVGPADAMRSTVESVVQRSAALVRLGLAIDDAFEVDEPILLRVQADHATAMLKAVVQTANEGTFVDEKELNLKNGTYSVELPSLPAGVYRVTIQGDQNVLPVTDLFEVYSSSGQAQRSLPESVLQLDSVRRLNASRIRWTENIVTVSGAQAGSSLRPLLEGSPEYVVITHPEGWQVALKPSEIDARVLACTRLADWLHLDEESPSVYSKEWAPMKPQGKVSVSTLRVVLINEHGQPLAVGAYRSGGLQYISPISSSDYTAYLPPDSPMRDAGGVGAPPPEPPQPDNEGHAPESTVVTRYPSIDMTGQLRPGGEVLVTVDLALVRDLLTQTTGINLNLPKDWAEVAIQASLIAPLLKLSAADGAIVIRNGEASLPWKLKTTVAADLAGADRVSIRVSFAYNGRNIGSARRAFLLEGVAAQATAAVTVPVPPKEMATDFAAPVVPRELPREAPIATTAGTFSLNTSVAPPKMTLEIYSLGAGQMMWHIRVPDEVLELCTNLPPNLRGTVNLQDGNNPVKDPPAYVNALFKAAGSLAAPGHKTFFKGLGERLFESTPRCFQDAYWELIRVYGLGFPIQIMSNDPYIPWELMRPYDATHPPYYLGVGHPVARWFMDYEGDRHVKIPRGRVATTAPDYKKRPPMRILPAAQRESQAILSKLPGVAIAVRADTSSFVTMFEDPGKQDIALIHYAGHGSCNSDQTDMAFLVLENGDVFALSLRNHDIALGANRHSVVFLNACQVGQSGLNLGVIGGFADALMSRHFGGLVAPLWSVYDDPAAACSTTFIEDVLLHGSTFAEALRKIRDQFGDSSPTFLSYLYYGDVMAAYS